MKNNIYCFIRSFLILLLFLLLPFLSFAQSLPPIPDVGEGVCVAGCGSTPSPTFSPLTPPGEEDTTPSPTPTPPLITKLQTANELDNQALEKLNEAKYSEVPPIINDAIDFLNDARDSLKTDEVCKDNPKAASKIDRSLKSSISDHKRALSNVERINLISVSRVNNDPQADEEGLISKLVNSAKKFIKRAITRDFRVPNTVGAVCGVRG